LYHITISPGSQWKTVPAASNTSSCGWHPVLCYTGYGDMLSFSWLFCAISLMQELTIYCN